MPSSQSGHAAAARRRRNLTVDQLMRAQGLTTLDALSRASGISTGTLSAIRRGLAPSPKQRDALMKALKISSQELADAITASQRYFATAG